MEIKAPAKINLYLNVGEKRNDGFHDIISIMVKVGLWDIITLEEHEEIVVEGPAWLPMEENLVYKAAVLLKEHSGVKKGCMIKLEKNIPPGRGLGGGSSDCASILKALNQYWSINLEIKELEQLGMKLGSDVNFFLYPGSCCTTGRGEVITRIDRDFEGEKNIILVDTGISITTAYVYSRYSGGQLTAKEKLDKIINSYRSGNWSEILKNDFEATVFREYPVLNDLKNRLANWGLHPLLSGSGSCVFALVDDVRTAESVSQVIRENFEYETYLVKAL